MDILTSMEAESPQFVGPSCGQYGVHTFYRGFRYTKDGKSKNIDLGEFFFVRMSAEEDPCIGELQLLCSNRNNDQQLAALRLYFLPEQTPEGRLSHHGEDEVLVASDRLVLKLDDLVSWITDEVEWNHGIKAPCIEKSSPLSVEKDGPQNDTNNNNTTTLDPHNHEDGEGEPKKTADIKEENCKETIHDEDDPKVSKVRVLSYQSYCRYRTILKRIDGGDTSEWLQNAMVIALGGFAPPGRKTHVLFCRDTFEHDELSHHELNCEYLAPTIKGKKKKRKTKNTRSISPESNTSEEFKAVEIKNNQTTNGLKQPPIKNEQEFLQRLFKFMKKRNTPIHRVPHLGFKQIDLYVFYSFAQKLGGYNKITNKRLWKHVYDELGGNPGSTSAATCTRRHYERLLLPFERFIEGIVYKPSQRGKKSQKKRPEQALEGDQKENLANGIPAKADYNPANGPEAQDEYTFIDSNQENSNSKDSNSNEFNSAEDDTTAPNEPPFSDEDSKTVWSIQKQPECKDEASQDKDESKPIKPLIIQKGQSETFAEKEKKWDEIRRKNAAARKWVRQSRSSKGGCKTPVPEIPPFKKEKLSADPESAPVPQESLPVVQVKSEIQDPTPNQTPLPIPVQNKEVSDRKPSPPHPSETNNIDKFLPPCVSAPQLPNTKIKLENNAQKRRHVLAKETPSHLSSDKKLCSATAKTTGTGKHAKSWCGYPTNSGYSAALHPGMDLCPPGPVKGHHPTAAFKAGTRSEPDIARDYTRQTGRQSVSSLSASSVVSADTGAGEEKPLLPQRRPSVIQHTEYAATSPSPSPSPKQAVSDFSKTLAVKDSVQPTPISSPKINLLPSQLSYSMTGKVAEWLTKGVHEVVVACRTPSTAVEKIVELHDKVMMPSSCKTPGAVGTGRVPVNNLNKSKQSNVSHTPKTPRSKYSGSHRQRNVDLASNGGYGTMPPRNDARGSSGVHPKMLHPVPTSYSSVMTNPAGGPAPKYQQTATNQKNKVEPQYPNGPYYHHQPKRYKMNNVAPAMIPAVSSRPSLMPFVRQQQTYCTPPMSDIPKTLASTHNDYESAVLDLSVKRKPAQAPPPPRQVAPVNVSPVPEEGVCLDLSVKKKPHSLATDNGIENITPPLPISPNPSSHTLSYMHSSMKPLPTLIALQDLASEQSLRRIPPMGYSSGTTSRMSQLMASSASVPTSVPSLAMPPAAMYPGSSHGKLAPGIVNGLPPAAYSKDMAKNLYIPGSTRHSQFSPYVIPPFYSTNWTSMVNAPP